MREVFGFKNYVTLDHLEKMNKIIMATGMMVGYAYACEFFIAWYSGSPYESFTFVNRAFGPYWWAYWTMVSCNVLIPQVFWFKKMRRHIGVMFVISLFVNIGMWFERYVIVVTSLHRDFLPVELEVLHSNLVRLGMDLRIDGRVLLALLALRPLLADDRDVRSQRRHAP